MKSIDLVREFHVAFGQPVNNKPTIYNEDVNRLRVNLIQEELDELDAALVNGNPVAVLDALADLQYVLDGSWLSLGFSAMKDEAMRAVHVSNMTKGGLRSDGKILKGPNFKPPNLAAVIAKHSGSFTNSADAAAHAIATGSATVVRDDGSTRVHISIPPADCGPPDFLDRVETRSLLAPERELDFDLSDADDEIASRR